MAIEREKIYQCEVKRRRVKSSGGYESFWKIKDIGEALKDADTEFRCKDCGGAVKLFRQHKSNGPAPHVEHRERQDSEYCSSGMYFRKASDGREPRRAQLQVV